MIWSRCSGECSLAGLPEASMSHLIEVRNEADEQVRVRRKSGSCCSVPRSSLSLWSDWSGRDHLETRRGTSRGENGMASHTPIDIRGDDQSARITPDGPIWSIQRSIDVERPSASSYSDHRSTRSNRQFRNHGTQVCQGITEDLKAFQDRRQR